MSLYLVGMFGDTCVTSVFEQLISREEVCFAFYMDKANRRIFGEEEWPFKRVGGRGGGVNSEIGCLRRNPVNFVSLGSLMCVI